MKLQTKVLLIIATAWLAICVIVVVDSKYIVARNYQDLEKQITEHRIHDTQRAFDRMLYSLSLYTVSWSQWDGSYNFMKVKSDKFIESNLIPETYKSAELNFIIFFDTSDHFYYGKSYDTATNTVGPVSPSLLDYLNNNESFVVQKMMASNKVGILQTKTGLIVMSSQPVVRSDGKGPVRGSLLMGYYLNDTSFATLSQTVGMKIKFFPISAVLKNNQLNDEYLKITSGEQYSEVIVNPKIEYGYVLLKDINGEPVGLMQIEIPRLVYQEGLSTAYHYLTIVLISGIIIILLMWYLLKIFVLDRVVSISNQVFKINREGQFDKKITVHGQDELGSMVFAINNMLGIISDSQHHLRYLASHDVLTKLPNREYFYKLLNRAIKKAKETNAKVAVMFLDLDKLKNINDRYGHAVGDQVIKEAANRIKKSLRQTDVVGRQSGDEFILFLQDIHDINVVTDTAKRILQATSAPFTIDDINITASFSVGISIYPDDGEETEELIKHADDVMYSTKMKSGNNYQFYSDKKN